MKSRERRRGRDRDSRKKKLKSLIERDQQTHGVKIMAKNKYE